ncbi:transposase [Accumulibacter sp.]|uniref:transposase n=1 Tax=Accumulibacter sp. TaxID=2053492 RepID=UPI00262AA37A|nr:transposase [Accumulibacter sp.]
MRQEIRKMRFEEPYRGWEVGRLTQVEVASLLGERERTFGRYLSRYEEGGMEGLIDRRLKQVSQRKAPVDEVMALTASGRRKYVGWSFYAWYRKDEGTRSYTWVNSRLRLPGVWEVIESRGLFSSFYSGRGSHYWQTPEGGGKVDKQHLTQFGQAMKRLGIEMIAACLPEARGRSERLFRTHQDRLPRELALAGVTDMAGANRYLTEVYRLAFNVEFMPPAMAGGSAFVGWIGGALDDIVRERFEHTVGNDSFVSFEGMKLQIPADRHRCHYVKAKVTVRRRTDRTLAILQGPRKLVDYDQAGNIMPLNLKVAA